MVTASGSALLDKLIAEDFKRFRARFVFLNTDEELDKAAKAFGCRSTADLRTIALFLVFMNYYEDKGRWN